MEVSWVARNLLCFFLLLISLTLHEWSHAFVADRLGDPNPRREGRVTLNPMAHADLFGTILFPLLCIFMSTGFLFGWGRPVFIQPSYFKYPRWGSVLAESAGILANMVLCFVGAMLLSFSHAYVMLAYLLLELNAVLITFNLLPLPGLDGFALVRHVCKLSDETVAFLESWGFFILLLLINIPIVRYLLSAVVHHIVAVFLGLSTMIYKLFV